MKKNTPCAPVRAKNHDRRTSKRLDKHDVNHYSIKKAATKTSFTL